MRWTTGSRRPRSSPGRLGADAERRVRRHYRLRGWRVLDANAWAGGNELDLVVRRGAATSCSVEVKARSGHRLRRSRRGGDVREGAPPAPGRGGLARGASRAPGPRARLRGGCRRRGAHRADADRLRRAAGARVPATRVRPWRRPQISHSRHEPRVTRDGCRTYRRSCARARGHPRPRRSRRTHGRGRGAPPERCAGVRDRRAARQGVPGGEGARAQRHRARRARVAAPADHGQPRSRRPPQGGLGLRSADRARDPRRVAAGPAPSGSPSMRRSASSRSTGACGPCRGVLVAAEAARQRGLSTPALCGRVGAPEAALAGIEAIPVRHLREAVAYLRGRIRARRRCEPADAGPAPSGARSGGRPRAGARAARARARRRGTAQPAAGRAAGHRQDDARAPAAGHPAAADARARRSRSRGSTPSPGCSRRAGRSSIGRRSARRTTPRRRPRSSAAGRGRGRARRASPIAASSFWTSSPSSSGSSLEALRQPLEDGTIAIARVFGRALFPARFLLVGTMNLCPCGARGDPGAECRCSPTRLTAYRERALACAPRPLRPRRPYAAGAVGGARRAARRALGSRAQRGWPGHSSCFATRPPPFGEPAEALLGRAVDSLPLSARGRARVARVSATIAALAGLESVGPEHVAEALSYRVAVGAGGRRVTLGSVRLGDARYPPLLRELYDPPRLLYLRGGSPELLAAPAVAIVGARSCSAYGAQVARMLGRELAAAGLVVVSGLARGVDGEAHRGRPRRRRQDRRRARMRHRPRLPGGAPRARTPDLRSGGRRLRVRARNRAGALAVPGEKPDHRGAGARDDRRRGAREVGSADHHRLRARARPGGVRGARRDHLRARRRARTSSCVRVRRRCSLRPTCSHRSGSSRRSPSRRRPSRRPPERCWACSPTERRRPTISPPAPGCGAETSRRPSSSWSSRASRPRPKACTGRSVRLAYDDPAACSARFARSSRRLPSSSSPSPSERARRTAQ